MSLSAVDDSAAAKEYRAAIVFKLPLGPEPLLASNESAVMRSFLHPCCVSVTTQEINGTLKHAICDCCCIRPRMANSQDSGTSRCLSAIHMESKGACCDAKSHLDRFHGHSASSD